MALSGSITKNVGSHWRLSISWTATQDIAANTSTVTAKMYWQALDSYGAIYSSSSDPSGINHDGGTYSVKNATAGLSANQKKLVNTYSFVINHKADGTASFTLDGYFDIKVTLGGTYYGRVSLTAKAFALNTIPRRSTMTSSTNVVAGSDRTITVSRASTSFTHKVYLDVQDSTGAWVNIKRIDFAASASTAFMAIERDLLFSLLDGATSRNVRWNLHTYSGATSLGYDTYTGKLTMPGASTLSSKTAASYYIDQSMIFDIDQSYPDYKHDIKVYCDNTLITTFKNAGTGITWTPFTTEQSAMYALTPNANSVAGKIEVLTYYGTQLVGTTSKIVTFKVRNSDPSFAADYFYQDTNTKTTALTNNYTYIIQHHSLVNVILPINAFATPKNKATIKSYTAKLNGVSKTVAAGSAAINFDFGAIESDINQTLSVTATDSRGNTTTTTKIVTVIPYSAPVVSATVKRLNNYEAPTTITLSGKISPLSTPPTNALSPVTGQAAPIQFRYKENIEAAVFLPYWTDMTYSTTGATYKAVPATIELDSTKSYVFEIRVTDKLSTTTVTKTVAAGSPIMFVDSKLKSVGFGKVPTKANSVEIKGSADITGSANIGSTLDAQSLKVAAGQVHPLGQYGLHLNNSDVIGANGIYFNDATGAAGEGLMFPKTGYADNTTTMSGYDQLRVMNGTGYLNDKAIFSSDNEILWEGAFYMLDIPSHVVVPSKKMSECPNGWVLVWSQYAGAAVNSNWNFTYVPKAFAHLSAGGFWCDLYDNTTTPKTYYKYMYASDSQLSGHSRNSGYICLRYVLSF